MIRSEVMYGASEKTRKALKCFEEDRLVYLVVRPNTDAGHIFCGLPWPTSGDFAVFGLDGQM